MQLSEKNLVVCDKEFRYASSLGENISARKNLAIQVHVCSSLERVEELQTKKRIHIFVVDESYDAKERSSILADQTFVLVRGKGTDLQEHEVAVYKYQSADTIMQTIFEYYKEQYQENLTKVSVAKKTKIIGIYSPIHRVGKSEFAVALGKECAIRRRTLYINLEEYIGHMELAKEGTLGDLIYYMRQEEGNFSNYLQEYVKKMEEMDYLLPIPNTEDLRQVTQREWEDLIEAIEVTGLYEIIILDFGEAVQGLFSLLGKCQIIYQPILADWVSEKKVIQFDENMQALGMEHIMKKLFRFVMPENTSAYGQVRGKEESV